eukprot:490254-Prymnesium_polylepis.1
MPRGPVCIRLCGHDAETSAPAAVSCGRVGAWRDSSARCGGDEALRACGPGPIGRLVAYGRMRGCAVCCCEMRCGSEEASAGGG